MIKVLIAEDHPIVRMAVAVILRETFEEVTITEAWSMKEIKDRFVDKRFDLLILDINIPGGNSAQMIAVIRSLQPDIPILIMSSYDEDTHSLRYLKAGADGYIHKDNPPDEIRRAIRKVINREKYAGKNIQGTLLEQAIKEDAITNELLSLSDRELEIMSLLMKGLRPTEIKLLLNIGLTTISTHKLHIMQKMKVSNVVQLVAKLKKGV